MKVLVTGDWHGDYVTYGVPRYTELQRAVSTTVSTAIQEKVDLYVFGGDLCDPDSGVSVFRCIRTALDAAITLANNGVNSLWIPGNHCVIEDGSGDSVLTPFRALHSIPFIRLAERPGVQFYGAKRDVLVFPFAPTSHTYNPEQIVEEVEYKENVRLIVSHLSVPGVQPGEETTEMPRGRDVVLPLEAIRKKFPEAIIVNHHYHRQQIFEDVHIPGSLMRLTFGEEQHRPGFMIIEVP